MDASSGAFVERIYARERAHLLARLLERGPLIQAQPEIGKPESAQAEPLAFFDLIHVFECLQAQDRLIHSRYQSH